jgi:hypothetical protein
MMTAKNKAYQLKETCRLSMGRFVRPLLLCVALCSVNTVVNAETPAGARIDNSATLYFTIGGADQSVPSNTATVVVAERLDVALTRATDGPIQMGDGAIPVLLINRGNGVEAFRLSANDGSNTPPSRFAIDTDGNGQYDADRDTLLTDATTAPLAPGGTLALLLLANDGGFITTEVTIVAQAVTGSGPPGTTFAGQGDGGGDAVVGATGAQAQITVGMGPRRDPALVKTQTVLAPDGSSRAVRGAVITYTLRAVFVGTALAARIVDPVPAGTVYVADSLVLDGVPLSDAADGDAGQAENATIAVALGDIAVARDRTVQFQVRIQ